MEEVKEKAFKFINFFVEFVFVIVYYLLLSLFDVLGGEVHMNGNGYSLSYQGYVGLGNIHYSQMLTFRVLSVIYAKCIYKLVSYVVDQKYLLLRNRIQRLKYKLKGDK